MNRISPLLIGAVVLSCLELAAPSACSQSISVPQSEPYTNDAYTLLLEHFDGSTTGFPTGPSVTYTNGVFGQGVHLNIGSWVCWDDFEPLNFESLSEGTVEFWGKLDTLDYGGLEPGFIRSCFSVFSGDTFYTTIRSNYPCSGYDHGDCDPHGGEWIVGSAGRPVTAGVWHHYATTWGSQGFHFYIDGVLVASTSDTFPQDGCTLFWAVGGPPAAPEHSGAGFTGAIDELRISNVQRTFTNAFSPTLSIQTAAVRVQWFAAAGVTYQLQWSTDFLNWSNLLAVLGTGAQTNVVDWTENGVRRFYRVNVLAP